ncbi:MAG: vitamin K epoxide reductase family protein [Candidatus Aenigmarchaeota archaeon]|nr:vitamin K epoxide reductase family protein [Candidatus Aenigmarchaeota archaeon]
MAPPVAPPAFRRNLTLVAILAVVGIILSGYLLYTKFSGAKSFCDFSAEVSCDAVSQSPYAEFPANSGIPISGLGVIAFLIFLIPALRLRAGKDFSFLHKALSARKVSELLLVWAGFSILFYVYLTYLELFVIYAICPLCVITFALTIIMTLLLAQNVRRGGKA